VYSKRGFAPLIAVLFFATASPSWAAAPAPGEGKLDWIRLASGEWLAGELKYMRNEDLEFDSDKLDVLSLKWEDVAEVRISRPLTYAFTGNRAVIGPGVIQDGKVRVQENGQTREFPASDLLSIIPGQGSEWDAWSGNFSLGFVGRSGNTDQVDYTALGFVRRDGQRTRFDLKYAGNFGQVNGVRSVNNQLGSARVDLFVSRYLFVTPGALELYSDEFQNIELRTSVSAGAGVYMVKEPDLEWFVRLGAGYLSTRYRSVQIGESAVDKTAALIPSTALEWEPMNDLTLNLDYTAHFSIPDAHKMFHNLVAMLTFENLRFVDLNTSITWDHVSQPRARDDGTLPKQNDLRTAFGIGVDF
jgi:hypothetical protein